MNQRNLQSDYAEYVEAKEEIDEQPMTFEEWVIAEKELLQFDTPKE